MLRHRVLRFSAALLIAALWSDAATAQRPVHTFDPFYQGEVATRGFHDGYLVRAEVAYRPPALLQGSAASPQVSGPLSLNLRVEYQLSEAFDLGMYLDATGGGGPLSLSWITLRYYQSRQDHENYALRLAVDPGAGGVSGFPQLDLAFLYAQHHSPTVRTDYSFGVRRVQIGVQELISTPPDPVESGDPIVTPPSLGREVLRTQALGWEIHLATRYNLVFDPAGSTVFVDFSGEAGRYDLVEWSAENEEDRRASAFRGGVLWMRTGFQVDRPSYRFAPFLAIPAKQWSPANGEYPRSRVRLGLQLTLR